MRSLATYRLVALVVVLGGAASWGGCKDSKSSGGEVCPGGIADGVCDRAAGENGFTCPADCEICDHNGFCSTTAGETTQNCPDDCPFCNENGTCDTELGETTAGCPSDCPVCIVDGRCRGDETPQNCPQDCPICVVDGVCNTAGGETDANCPYDCGAQGCDLQSITPQGGPTDFLVSDLYIPVTAAEAQTIGVDLDGDGQIDNKLGGIMSIFTGQGADPNPVINADIDAGLLVLLGRMYVDNFPTDATVLVQIFQGETFAVPPSFDGSDLARVDPNFPQDLYLCGELNSEALDAGPGTLQVPLPLPGTGPVFVEVQAAKLVGNANAQGWNNMMVGGGVTRAEINASVVPALTAYLNTYIAQDPTSSTAQIILGLFDNACDSGIAGCEGEAPDQGECQVGHTLNGIWLTNTEVRCNNLFHGATQPDVDITGDGVADLLSLGLRVTAVRVTIAP